MARSVAETVDIRASAADVFAYIDDIRNVGWHMTDESSMAMMGSKLRLDVLSERPTGLGATYRYSGKMLGLTLDFSESVTTYRPPHEKVWQTIGQPTLWIMSSYEMRLVVEAQTPETSRLTISIAYELPASTFWRIVGRVLADSYSRWCLRRMCRDAKRGLEARATTPASQSHG